MLSLRIKENYTELIPLLPHEILLSLIHEFSFVYKGNDLQTKISLTLVPKVTTSILVLGLRTFPARNSPRSPTRWFYEMAMLDSRSELHVYADTRPRGGGGGEDVRRTCTPPIRK